MTSSRMLWEEMRAEAGGRTHTPVPQRACLAKGPLGPGHWVPSAKEKQLKLQAYSAVPDVPSTEKRMGPAGPLDLAQTHGSMSSWCPAGCENI